MFASPYRLGHVNVPLRVGGQHCNPLPGCGKNSESTFGRVPRPLRLTAQCPIMFVVHKDSWPLLNSCHTVS